MTSSGQVAETAGTWGFPNHRARSGSIGAGPGAEQHQCPWRNAPQEERGPAACRAWSSAWREPPEHCGLNSQNWRTVQKDKKRFNLLIYHLSRILLFYLIGGCCSHVQYGKQLAEHHWIIFWLGWWCWCWMEVDVHGENWTIVNGDTVTSMNKNDRKWWLWPTTGLPNQLDDVVNEDLSIITISAESGPVDQLKGRSTEGCHRGHASCHHSEHSLAQEDQPFPKCLSVIVLWQTHANAWWSTFQILPKVDPAWSDNVGSIKIVYPQQINQFTLRVALSLVGSIPFSHLYIPATTQKQRSRETTEQRNRKTNKNSEAEREKLKKNWHNYHNFL